MAMMKQPTRRALSGKRGHCSVCAVHGGESDDPILALMRELNLPVTREDYLNLAYLGRPPKQLFGGGGGGFARDSGPLGPLVPLLPPATGTSDCHRG